MRVSSDGREGDELWGAIVFFLFWTSTRRESESGEYSFLQYKDGTRPKGMVLEKLNCAFLRFRADDQVGRERDWELEL